MTYSDWSGGRRQYTYLLSLWQEGEAWRAALRPAGGGARQGFGDLDQLVAFLLRIQDRRTVADRAAAGTTGCTEEHEPGP